MKKIILSVAMAFALAASSGLAEARSYSKNTQYSNYEESWESPIDHILGTNNDRWGVGFFHFGLSQQLLSGLAEMGDPRHSEEGIEAFYNIELTKWNYLSMDIQFVDPWNPSKKNEVIAAVRMQTKF